MLYAVGVGVLMFVFLTIGYLVTAGLTYVICVAFGLPWSWLIALAIYAIILIIRWVLRAASGN